MSALVRLLYPLPAPSRRATAVISWWERRRLRFNLVVGGAGVISLAGIWLIGLLPPGSHGLLVPRAAIVVYAALANLFYTAGWFSELLFHAWWRDNPPAVGPFLFRHGLIFSVGLTLLPMGFATLAWGFRILQAFF